MLEDFLKNYDRDHYKRHPKSKKTARVVWAVLIVGLVAVTVRAVLLLTS
jgi:hypothetical protein